MIGIALQKSSNPVDGIISSLIERQYSFGAVVGEGFFEKVFEFGGFCGKGSKFGVDLQSSRLMMPVKSFMYCRYSALRRILKSIAFIVFVFKCSEFVGKLVTVVRQVFRFSGKSVARVFCPFRLTGKFVARVFGVFRFAGKLVARVLELFRKFGSTAIILCLKQVAS